MSVALTELYNQSLDKIGARANLSLATERSREAEACNRWFASIRDQVLASARWPCATKTVLLGLLNEVDNDGVWEAGEARPTYRFVYNQPQDLLHPQFLTNFGTFTMQAYDDDKLAIMTDFEDAALVYTFRQERINLWSAELRQAIMLGLAANICVPLTGKTSRARALVEEANAIVVAARVSAANTDDDPFDVLPDWIAARGYAEQLGQTRFYYPYGPLFSSWIAST